jgi:hypothetical protein
MKRTGSPTAQAPHEARGHQTLSAYIRARFDEFSRSQKDVAQYIVDHLDEVAFQTAEELARRASTSSSTVVRFSQALGFEGFPELQTSAREEFRRRVAAGLPEQNRNGSGAAPLFSLDQSDFETAVAADHVNVEETARRISRRSASRGACSSPAPTRWRSSRATCATCSCCSTSRPSSSRARRRRRSAGSGASTTRRSSSACRPAARTRSSCAR